MSLENGRSLTFTIEEVKPDLRQARREADTPMDVHGKMKRARFFDRALFYRVLPNIFGGSMLILLTAPVTLRHPDAAEHLGGRLQFHRRSNGEQAKHHEDEDDELLHG